MKLSLLKIIFTIAFFSLSLLPFIASASSTDDISGWGWSSNIGWISFNCTNVPGSCTASNYGVDITGSNLTGHAWSPNIGWIQFGGLGNSPTNGNSNAVLNPGTGKVSGWARAVSAIGRTDGWDGWISLSGSSPDYSVTLSESGSTLASQYTCTVDCAWGSDVVGWVDFSGVKTGLPTSPILSVGNISASNTDPTAMLQKNSNLSWFDKLIQTTKAYASGSVPPNVPIWLTTPIRNSGIATSTPFTNKYFIDKYPTDNSLIPGVLNESLWDLVITVPAPNGIGVTPPDLNSTGYVPMPGLPIRENGIVFCADVGNAVSGVPLSEAIATRCTLKEVVFGEDPTCLAPTIDTQPANTSAAPGDTVMFTVTATGTSLSYQWKKGTENVGTNSNSYTINNVQMNDAGSYTVKVTNNNCSLYTTSNAATLTVNPVNSVSPACNLDHNDPCYSGELTAPVISSPTRWSWSCRGTGTYTTTTVSCHENKSPIFTEP